MSTLQMAPAAAATACATMQRLRRGTWMVPGHAKGGMKQQLMAAAVLHISNLLGQAQPAAEDQHVYKMPADASDDHIWEEQLGKGLQAAVAAHVQHIFQPHMALIHYVAFLRWLRLHSVMWHPLHPAD
jgi:nucleoside phosphorylase